MEKVHASFTDFLEHLRHFGDKIALTEAETGRSFSYAELYRLSFSFASRLPDSLTPGVRVVVYDVPPIDWVPVFFALVLRGCVVVPVDTRVSWEFLDQVCKLTSPELMISSDVVDEKISIPLLRFDDLRNRGAQDRKLPEVDPDSPMEIIFTSGTWSQPKGVTLSQRNVLTNLRQVLEVYHHRPEHVCLAILPLAHAYQQTAGLFVPLEVGSRIVFLSKIGANEIRHAVVTYKVAVLIAVPRVLQLIVQGIRRSIQWKFARRRIIRVIGALSLLPYPLRSVIGRPLRSPLGPSLHTIVIGGSPLSTEIDRFFSGAGYRVLVGYGLSECSPVIAISQTARRKAGEVGQVLPGISLNFSQQSEVVVEGGNLFLGYWPDAAPAVFNTGDIGYYDKSQNLILRGRTKNLIIYDNGEKVFCEDVEFILNSLEQVEDSCVVEIRNGKEHEVVCLVRGIGNTQDILDAVRMRLPFGVRIDRVQRCGAEQFPYTHTMKPDRKLVRQMCIRATNASSSHPD